jgi:serine/threonine protein kinase
MDLRLVITAIFVLAAGQSICGGIEELQCDQLYQHPQLIEQLTTKNVIGKGSTSVIMRVRLDLGSGERAYAAKYVTTEEKSAFQDGLSKGNEYSIEKELKRFIPQKVGEFKETISGDLNELITRVKELGKLKNSNNYLNIVSRCVILGPDSAIFLYEELDETLNKYLNDNELDLVGSLRIFQNLMEIANFLHTKKWIHCDLKLENIMKKKDESAFKAIDIESAVHNSGCQIGSNGYIPPEYLDEEYFKSNQTSFPQDIFALGILEITIHQVLMKSKKDDLVLDASFKAAESFFEVVSYGFIKAKFDQFRKDFATDFKQSQKGSLQKEKDVRDKLVDLLENMISEAYASRPAIGECLRTINSLVSDLIESSESKEKESDTTSTEASSPLKSRKGDFPDNSPEKRDVREYSSMIEIYSRII